MKHPLEQTYSNFELFYDELQADRSVVLKGEIVPLHHHSGNEGFLYLLCGAVKITTYAWQQQGEHFVLKQAAEKIYRENDFAVLTKQYNVHKIEVLEDGVIVDVFSTKETHQSFQKFLVVVEEKEDGVLITKPVSHDHVAIPQRMLEAEFEQRQATEEVSG